MATLLQAENIIKRYGFQQVLSGASLTIAEKQKIGVIGRNGAGKSTLMRILVGDEKQDDGTVTHHAELRLGYLKQHEELNPTEQALAYLTRTTEKPQWVCAKIAARFALTPDLLAKPMGQLSSGFRMRVKLSAMLIQEPNLILFDEPTNFLDISTQLLLEEFLRDWNGAFLVVSHDREFLKNTCTETLEIEKGRAKLYPGNIEAYLAWKEEQVEVAKNENRKIETQQKHLKAFVDRFRFKASKASQAQSKLKQLGKLHKIEIEHPMKSARIRIPVDKIKKGIAVRVEDVEIGYTNAQTGAVTKVAGPTTFDIDRTKHAAILGDNGQGKTTLLRTLAHQLPALAGEYKWGPDLKLAYYGQTTLESMPPRDTVQNYLSRMAAPDVLLEETLKMAGNFLFKDDDLEKPVSVLSGGERARLCLAGHLLSKATVFLLDEPTNHLDFETVEALGNALREYPGTILFVSHNRTFVNLVATMVLELKNGMVARYNGSYEEYIGDLSARLDADLPERRVMASTEGAQVSNPAELSDEERALQEKANVRAQIEAEKKKIRTNERQRRELEDERDQILAEMAMTPTNYSKTATIRLHAVNANITKLEDEWLEYQRNIEWLNQD